MRKVLVSWALLLGVLGVFQPAKADFRGGVCALNMHFTFNPPLQFGTGPAGPKTWTLTFNSVGPANCVISPTQVGDALVRTSSGNVIGGEATGNGLAWTCQSILADALWSQDFVPYMPVPPSNATLAFSVGQGATIVISSNVSSLQGFIHIDSVPPASQCAGAGLASFNATGVEELHDPELPQ